MPEIPALPGTFVAIVGPSGAGKDTVINYARERVSGHTAFVFPRRVITRVSDGKTEDHDTLTPEAFAKAEVEGAFAFSWGAHDLHYGLPSSIDADIGAGRIVVANVSRSIVPDIAARYGQLILVIVSAHPDIIAKRLADRGREDAEAIAKRLKRMQVEDGLRADAVLIENSGPVEMAGERLLAVLRDAATESEALRS
jgi:ribose 1,5-bisphosphokinase